MAHAATRTETVTITGIAAGGAGVGRLADGRVAFIHGTAPGDRVEARITSVRKRWTRAEVVRMIEAAPGRREPPCPLFGRCGGCTLQHLNCDDQLRAKREIVVQALRRIGHIDGDVPAVVAAANEFEYRNRVAFQLRRLDADRVVAGFHMLERPGRILDVDERCLLPEPEIRRTWQGLRLAWGRGACRLPAGASLRLTLQSAPSGTVGLMIEDGFGPGRPDELIARVPGLVAIWKRDGDGTLRCLAREATLHDAGGMDLVAGVFTQVNRAVASLLEAHVRERCGDVNELRVIDAYCGTGTHGARLAAAGARVTGIELDARAVAQARRREVPGFRIVEGRVEDHLRALLPADAVLVNPPRTGLDASVCDSLLEQPPARLIYVSCNPATLARDCARLVSSFTIRDIRCFDMFPQTAHIETVVELQCATT